MSYELNVMGIPDTEQKIKYEKKQALYKLTFCAM